jgi:hypothetical protein
MQKQKHDCAGLAFLARLHPIVDAANPQMGLLLRSGVNNTVTLVHFSMHTRPQHPTQQSNTVSTLLVVPTHSMCCTRTNSQH